MRELKTFSLTGDQALQTINFLQSAYLDYIAARKLLNTDLLIQGCHLANTSIEKYFKGAKALLGEPVPRHHDITASKFRNSLKNKFPTIYNRLNFDFVEFLVRVYRLRYLDDIERGYSVVLRRNKILSELDFTINLFEESFRLKPDKKQSLYHGHKEERNPLLWHKNYLLNGINRDKYVRYLDKVIGLRKLSNGFIIEVNYPSPHSENDGIFLEEIVETDPADPQKVIIKM